MSHGAGSAAHEARASRRSEGCCGASSGVATWIPLQPAICGYGLPASTKHLLERGPLRRRIAGITTQISGLRVRIGVEPRLVAQSGRTEMSGYLSAFGVKRTCAMVRLRPPRSRLTHMYGPAVRCKRTLIETADVRSCINVSGL